MSDELEGEVDRADRVAEELDEAELVCGNTDCEICPDPERGLCPGAVDSLIGRVEWAMEELRR